eukprot:gb/GFBE01058831.1/.p1 GENE.gb/GFBE01058831.1/~~gb/GFBE01058831.1/.p1  ORF type:complete len:714 (+),score=104.22 gb/GFBE01058831.1/:1-2142(+)
MPSGCVRKPSSRFLKLLDDLRDCHLQELDNALPSWLLEEVVTSRSELSRLDFPPPGSCGSQSSGHGSQQPVHVNDVVWQEDDHQVPAEPIMRDLPSSGDVLEVKDNLQWLSVGSTDQDPKEDSERPCLQEGATGTTLDADSPVCTREQTVHIDSGTGGDSLALALMDVWKNCKDPTQTLRETTSMDLEAFTAMADHEDVEEVVAGACGLFVAFPGSKTRLCWDLLGGLLIFYDLISIPLGFFDPPEVPFTIFMDWFTLLFWTLNVPATLTVGYIEDGLTIIDPKQIFRHYMKTWFAIDLFTLVPDWIFTIVASGGVGDSVRLLRTLRLTRTVRLLRLVKLRRIIQSITDSLDSEYSSLVFNIIKMMVILCAVNHAIACAWFGIGTIHNGTPTISWIKQSDIENASLTRQYLTSLHWSLTQFTPASMSVEPVTEGERAFAVCVLLFALVGFAYVVGSITGSLAQLRALTEKTSKEFWLLRRFLRRNTVPKTLGLRIQRYLEHMHGQQQITMSMQQVALLSMLSKQLMDELQCSINLPQLNVHPLFLHLKETSFITMSRLAKEAVSRSHMARGDTLFLPDQHATCMYMVASGSLHYKRSSILGSVPGHKIEVSEKFELVSAMEDWLSEPALWTADWYHHGQAIAQSECEILTIPSSIFADVLNRVKPVAAMVAAYGRHFMVWLEELRSQNMLSDVIQGDEVGDLIASFIPNHIVN